MTKKDFGGVIAAAVTGLVIVMALFGAYSVAHGARYEREYTTRFDLRALGLPHEELRAVRSFLRTVNGGGIPEECSLALPVGNDPTIPEDWEMWCPEVIRVDRINEE